MPRTAQSPGPLFALALASIALVGPLVIHLFMPVIPAVKVAFGVSDAVAQLTFTVALFTMAFATLAYGSLADRYGRRPVLLSGLCLFLAGSVISAKLSGTSSEPFRSPRISSRPITSWAWRSGTLVSFQRPNVCGRQAIPPTGSTSGESAAVRRSASSRRARSPEA